MASEAEYSDEVQTAMWRIGTMVEGGLQAGADRCVLAAACIWTGVKETIELTDPECTAAALRSIAHQIEPPAPRQKVFMRVDRALVGGENVFAGIRRMEKAAPAKQQNGLTQNIACDVVDEVIDLLEQGHSAEAVGLLMALRSRLRGTMA